MVEEQEAVLEKEEPAEHQENAESVEEQTGDTSTQESNPVVVFFRGVAEKASDAVKNAASFFTRKKKNDENETDSIPEEETNSDDANSEYTQVADQAEVSDRAEQESTEAATKKHFLVTALDTVKNSAGKILRGTKKTNDFLSPKWLVLPDALFYFLTMFMFSVLIMALETIQFHVLLVVTNYLKATFIVSLAFLGIAMGGLLSFYLSKIHAHIVMAVCAVITFFGIILGYYNIINIGYFEYPYFLLVPFIAASIIISTTFSLGNSNTIYFVNLLSSAIGSITPIFLVPIFKSETSMILLMFIPLFFLVLLSLRLKNIFIKIAGVLGAVYLVTLFIPVFQANLETPEQIPQDVFENRIISEMAPPEATAYRDNYVLDFFNSVYEENEEGTEYVFNSDEYNLERADNLLGVMGFRNRFHIPFLQYFEPHTLLDSPREIPADVFEDEIVPYIQSEYSMYFDRNYDRLFLERSYELNEEAGMYELVGDDYDLMRAKYLLTELGHMRFIDLNFDVRPNRSIEDQMKIFPQNNRVLLSEDDMLGRVEYTNDDDYMYMSVNGVILDGIDSYNGAFYDPRVPHQPHIEEPEIFIVGLSADGIVKSARRRPGAQVSGIEINPIILRTMQEDGQFSEFANTPYQDVEVYEGEGRSFLENTDQQYDMVTLMNIHMEHGPVSTLSPENFHTIEGTHVLLDSLSEDGYVVYEEILMNQRSEFFFLKFLNTVRYAMEEYGIEDWRQHIHVYKWDFGSGPGVFRTVILKRTPFTEEEINNFDPYLASINQYYSGYGLVYSPFRNTGTEVESFIRAEEPQLSTSYLPNSLTTEEFVGEIIERLPSQDDVEFMMENYNLTRWNRFVTNPAAMSDVEQARLQRILNDVAFPTQIDLSPVTDDSPFPYDVYETKTEVIDIFKVVLFLSMFLIIPVFLLLLNSSGRYKISLTPAVLFTSAIGFGYMLVEIVLMQRFQLFIGDPTYSLIVVLGGLLLFSGVGSFVSRFFPRWLTVALMALIPVILVLTGVYLDDLFVLFGDYTFTQKLWISAGLIFPLTFLMGIPFPTMLEAIKRNTSNEFGALLFGVSGAFSTLAATAAIFINVSWGFSMSFAIGTICYCAGLLLFILIMWRVSRAEARA
ncbi:MAG: hypothetical protein ACLFR1_01830 [Spirochaetia bacterium]